MKFTKDHTLCDILGIEHPIIMAPMFLVSNTAMVISATANGITGCIPALNYRTERDLRNALAELKEKAKGPVGINLAVNKANYKLDYQVQACVDHKIDYVITSLGGPHKIMKPCQDAGVKVFCDVIHTTHAQKVIDLGADALIAVNNEAGGHLGPLAPEVLFKQLREMTDLPIINAGGVGNYAQLQEKLEFGFAGVSVGSPFIASEEAAVSNEYKQACVDYGADDIVVSTKISGTPCTVINTPYVQKIGTKQSKVERFLAQNKWLKKYAKMLTYLKGMKSIENAAFSATYKTVWCAGKTIEYTNKIEPAAAIIKRLTNPNQ